MASQHENNRLAKTATTTQGHRPGAPSCRGEGGLGAACQATAAGNTHGRIAQPHGGVPCNATLMTRLGQLQAQMHDKRLASGSKCLRPSSPRKAARLRRAAAEQLPSSRLPACWRSGRPGSGRPGSLEPRTLPTQPGGLMPALLGCIVQARTCGHCGAPRQAGRASQPGRLMRCWAALTWAWTLWCAPCPKPCASNCTVRPSMSLTRPSITAPFMAWMAAPASSGVEKLQARAGGRAGGCAHVPRACNMRACACACCPTASLTLSQGLKAAQAHACMALLAMGALLDAAVAPPLDAAVAPPLDAAVAALLDAAPHLMKQNSRFTCLPLASSLVFHITCRRTHAAPRSGASPGLYATGSTSLSGCTPWWLRPRPRACAPRPVPSAPPANPAARPQARAPPINRALPPNPATHLHVHHRAILAKVAAQHLLVHPPPDVAHKHAAPVGGIIAHPRRADRLVACAPYGEEVRASAR